MILVAIGANLPGPDGAPPLETCRRAAAALGTIPGFGSSALSRWYETRRFRRPGSRAYVNGVARLTAPIEPGDLLRRCKRSRRRRGGVRGVPNAARTLDLDIIAMGESGARRARPGAAASARASARFRAGAARPMSRRTGCIRVLGRPVAGADRRRCRRSRSARFDMALSGQLPCILRLGSLRSAVHPMP